MSFDELPDPLPIEPLSAEVNAEVILPGSKSITNRALICAALAPGESRLNGVLFSDDTAAMLGCLSDLGVGIEIDRNGRSVTIDGGAQSFSGAVLDAKMSGTTSRFIASLAAATQLSVVLDGAAALRLRPMLDLWKALSDLGNEVTQLGEPGCLPVEIQGAARPEKTVSVRGDVSSQFLSGLLLSAPALPAGLEVSVVGDLVSVPYVAMTIAVMRSFGAEVSHDEGFSVISVAPRSYEAITYAIEPDASAASYFLALTAAKGGEIRVPGLGSESVQGDTAFAGVLADMGADVTMGPDGIVLRSDGALEGVTVDMADISDTAQSLAAIAPFASGPTTVTGVGFIRGKETDRIAAVVAEMNKIGVVATENSDGFTIEPGTVSGGVIDTYDDHRMAMSFAVTALLAPGIAIADPDCVSKTYPEFWQDLDSVRASGS